MAKPGLTLIGPDTLGPMALVLDEYGMGHRAYEFSKKGAEIVKGVCDSYSTPEKPRFVLGSIGPGTKLPSLGHIHYDEMYEGYIKTALGLIDGGCDIFLLETCQDPLQIKSAIHGCEEANRQRGKKLPIIGFGNH